jgi:transcriptional regulator with XRE-family HTH domain
MHVIEIFSLLYFYWVINMSFDYGVIGKRIKQAREDKGLTQEKLAESLDVSNAYISKIERGKTDVGLKRLSEISVVLEESMGYLLNGTNSSSGDYLRNEITDMLEGCSPETIKLVASVIKPLVEFDKKNRKNPY